MDEEFRKFAEDQAAQVIEAIHRFHENGPYFINGRCVFCKQPRSYHEWPCIWLELLEAI